MAKRNLRRIHIQWASRRTTMCDSGKAIEKKIPCVKETRSDASGYCMWRVDPGANVSAFDIHAVFDGCEVGETVTLEYCEMTEAELEALPEFEGW